MLNVLRSNWANLAACAAIGFIVTLCLADSVQSAKPRLVGFGCKGSVVPLYANAEDDFPLCAIIQPNVVDDEM